MIRLILILMFTCSCFISQAQVNIITTIAGKDTFGYSGDGGPATYAKLKAPYRICPDPLGNIYIADALNHRIRSISASGVITTVAGNGIGGYNGDGIPATNAEIEVPQGVFVDNNNILFICDAINRRIRKVILSSGVITTIAGTGIVGNGGDGGMATNAELSEPVGIFVNKAEDVFIADWGNKNVRKISKATGIITTIAGTGSGGFSGDGGPATDATIHGPLDVCTDTAGNVLISDQFNHRIRKVDAVTGIITTIVGTGTPGFSGDGGLAINARLNEPDGLFVDKDNNLFIADYFSGAVRKVDAATGIITTVAGTGVTGFSGDGGPATNAKLFCSDVFVDSFDNLIIADYENNRIRKVNNAVGVSGIDKGIESRLYPNPTKGTFSIHTPVNISLVCIYNIAGIRVYERTCTTTDTEIDISNQPSGVYMVYVQCGEQLYLSKIIKD